MKLFKTHKQPESVKDKAVNRIVQCILKIQSGFSDYLFSMTKNWDQKSQWVFLILVSLILGGMSILAIVVPYQLTKSHTYFLPDEITLSKKIPVHPDKYIITGKEYKMIQEYKSDHPNLQAENPLLFDSLNLVEQIYYSQKTIK